VNPIFREIPDQIKRRGPVIIILLVLAILLVLQESRGSDQVVISKGGPLFDSLSVESFEVDQANVRDFALKDEELHQLLDGGNFGFLYAFPLGVNTSRSWQSHGCTPENCAQVTFYDYESGGTVEAIVDFENGLVLDRWKELEARPGASPQILPRTIAIAAQDDNVKAVLGDIRLAEPMMAPMSVWLVDDDCQANWCVDLTFPAPDRSGKIFHVVVDLEDEKVARTFYTRGRPEREVNEIAFQGTRYQDGCHEQYGWKLCWEMTAHDGLDFYDVSFEDQPILSSAKIGQVEVYYPSWPGGYRDEIGYGASVRPFYGTEVVDLGQGFEVRQLFTEFLRWPNCICCYRYEQIMRFHSDGSFEPEFISHGPGCDDLSTYRPFWRFDVETEGSEEIIVQHWENGSWEQTEYEAKISLFDDVSPDGDRLATEIYGNRYLWQPAFTDPLDQDDGFLFVLHATEGEGDGPIATGPADSFWPPGQWLDGEIVSGEDIIVWYVPILKTKQSDPWWCMPDPEPDFSPCNALLRIHPVKETDLVAEATGAAQVSPTPIPLASSSPDLVPTATRTPASTPLPRPIAGIDPETVILNSGCGSCHAIGQLGESGKVGPDLSNIGRDATDRNAEQTAEEYIRESITNPSAILAPECPNGPCLDGIMPSDYVQRLSQEQIDTLVKFLLTQRLPVPTFADPDVEVTAVTEDPVSEVIATPAVSTEKMPVVPLITIGMVALILVLSLAIVVLLTLLRSPKKNQDS